jgi:tol-pal system protein YbgF
MVMARERSFRLVLAVVLVLAACGAASAANKEHQQMLAEIRMLQEQTAQLRDQLAALNETLRDVGTKLAGQTDASRKAFADQKLLVDTISSNLQVVREKVDDNNVRISSLSQELEAVRLTIPQAIGAAAAAAGGGAAPANPAGGQPAAAAQAPSSAAPPPGVSPQRTYELAWGDYVGAQYNLAISGFENYIRSYPRSEQAGDAQYFIGESYYQQGMFREAVTAFDRGIADYPNSKRVPDMYWKRGMAQNAIGQTDRARESWEFVVKNFPNSDAGRLARQRLDQMIRKDPNGDNDDQSGSD